MLTRAVKLLARNAAITIAIEASDESTAAPSGTRVGGATTKLGSTMSVPSPGVLWTTALFGLLTSGLPIGSPHRDRGTRRAWLSGSAADEANEVVDSLRIALRAMSLRHVGFIPGLRITALTACTMDIHPTAVHVTKSATERDVHAPTSAALADMRGTAPVMTVVALPRLVPHPGAREDRIDRGTSGGIG